MPNNSTPMDYLKPPPAWGADELTSFLETAHRNRFATFVHKPEAVQKLILIDLCYLKVHQDWKDPGGIIASFLSIRSHSAFRAACGLALAGQVTDTFPAIRSCLEYASYAAHMRKNPELEETWLRRHEGEESLKEARKAFEIGSVRRSIGDAKNAEVFEILYQRTIDFGAHPNERAISSSTAIVAQTEGLEYQQIFLHADGIHLDHALKTTAQAGVCALLLVQEGFSHRFDSVGATDLLNELREGL